MRSLGAALAHVHDAHGWIHRDVKPDNALLKWVGGRLVAKLSGFNLTGPPGVWDEACTPRYAAPEVLMSRTVSTASDAFCFGTLAYETLSGERGATAAERALDWVRRPCDAGRLARVNVPAGLVGAIDGCWAFDPAARPAMRDLVDAVVHAWDAWDVVAVMAMLATEPIGAFGCS